ncbi:MAG: DUF2791 family P-loop domain-containing protein [Alphaproteobacteria bacterium]|nr:DUF2791 family P-loop domain-containing protein [Alphaproteobacteria bacterium]
MTDISARNAIEALRAGVPNHAAILLLDTDESGLQQKFWDALQLVDGALRDEEQPEGMVIAGAFGAGKSHQLGCLGMLAQQQNFIVSLVPVSKETPLFDPGRLFAAAIRAAVVPDAVDDVMTAVMARLHPHSDRYEALEYWTTAEARAGRLSPLFAALLHLIPRRMTDPDDHARVGRFFAGGKLSIALVKSWLREAGAGRLFELASAREADLALQRLRFAPRFFRAAGYSGWCVLFDEVELIARYSALQRARSYAELTRWLGADKEERIPGMMTVAALTDDFPDQMFQQRRDDERLPPLLETRGLHRQAAMARNGMAWLQSRKLRLSAPDEAKLHRSLDKIAALYNDAYGWTPPPIEIGERRAGKSMRQYIKSWITTWDMMRLYGEVPVIAAETIAIDYSESSEIEEAVALSGTEDVC